MAVVATSTPKRHGFSIESLIGRRDDSPRRPAHVHLPRPEDFSSTRDVCRDSPIRELGGGGGGGDGTGGRSRGDGVSGGAARDRAREHVRSVDLSRDSAAAPASSPPLTQAKESLHRDALSVARDLYHSPRDSFRDAVRESFRDLHSQHHQQLHHRESALARGGDSLPSSRDSSGIIINSSSSGRASQQGDLTPRSDSFRGDGALAARPRSRQGTLSPPSSTTDDERPAGGDRRTSSPASSSPPPLQVSPRLEKTLSSSSPETENRLAGGWTSDDLKHLLGAGAFHHQGHHAAAGMDGSSLYSPLRVCNRSLSAAMSSLMPHQFGGLPVNPLSFYNLHRELGPHPGTHPLLAARYPGFVHPRYPLGPPPGLLFHPYRKPKRNRTAFSPSQLLQLEQAFEKNHYVVGQERKTLAGKLQLTETQVKVWFQNRRTKHKRMKAEEEATGGVVTSGDDISKSGADGHHEGGPGDGRSDAEDHDLLEDDVCSSDEELSVTEDS